MKLCIAFVLALTILASPALAENPSPLWEVMLYWQPENTVITLTSAGEIDRIPVPEKVAELYGSFDARIALSKNNQWLAFEVVPDYGFNGSVFIADLTAGTCCQELNTDYTFADGSDNAVFGLVGFSPSNDQLALITEQYADGCIEFCSANIMGIMVNPATMENTSAADFVLDNENPVEWNERGIVVTQHKVCLPGEMCADPLYLGLRVVRDPLTGESVFTTPIVLADYASDYGDHLPLTGEYISPYYFNLQNPEPTAIFIPGVIYFSPEMDSFDWQQSPSLVYVSEDWDTYNPNLYHFGLVKWVMDGNTILIRKQSEQHQAILLFRDGTQQVVDMPYLDFLTGTPDGWLMVEPSGTTDPTPESTTIYHYQFIDGELVVSELASLQGTAAPALLKVTPLGASVTQSFNTVPLTESVGLG